MTVTYNGELIYPSLLNRNAYKDSRLSACSEGESPPRPEPVGRLLQAGLPQMGKLFRCCS